jgi:hypothetical protein
MAVLAFSMISSWKVRNHMWGLQLRGPEDQVGHREEAVLVW